jgi:hypothetical protein
LTIASRDFRFFWGRWEDGKLLNKNNKNMKKYFPFFPKANQHALKNCTEQFGNSSSNWTSPEWEAGSGSDGGRSNASAKGKNGGKKKHPWPNWASPWKAGADDSIGRDAGTGNDKFGLLQVLLGRGEEWKLKFLKNWKNIIFNFPPKADQHAQKKSWEEFLHSSCNLASGPWEGIIGGKKKQSSFNRASAWDAGSDDGGSINGSAKGKNWWELDWVASSTAGDSDDSDDGSNSDSNASAKGKNGGKKKKADGNVNVHIYGCCIFI